MMQAVHFLMIFLSVFSLGSIRYILTAPDPAFAWQGQVFGDVSLHELEDDELYIISPTHDTRGLV
jgi:hypothetical protein